MTRPYHCFRDPLFLGSVALYALNRWVLKRCTSNELCHSYLNDLICITFWVPVLVPILRWCRLRPETGPPAGCEVLVPLVLWSIVFEIVLPQVVPSRGLAVADPFDLLCYAAGALVGAAFWGWWKPLTSPPASSSARRETGGPGPCSGDCTMIRCLRTCSMRS